MKPSGIHILPPELADKIAAGEVVQRPASAVKELMENSIDAGARDVTVIIRDFGKTMIQVTDDGSGMDEGDAVLSFHRHATSKISTHEDLDRIVTLGFRGEALAAIGAVSHAELRTRRKGSDIGTLVRVEGGVLKKREPANCPEGTTVSVRNLFYNTPGRRKFLKSDQTEFRHILDVFQRTCLAHPDISFSLISGGETVMKCPAAALTGRVGQIFGEKLAAPLIPFSEDAPTGKISGFLGRPEYARKGRTDQYLYLNGRPIVSRGLNFAVYRAYEHLLEKGSFPFFIIFMEADPLRVDVNVHPSKNEVKFEDESLVQRAIASVVRKALSSQDLSAVMTARTPGTDAAGETIRLRQVFPADVGSRWEARPGEIAPAVREGATVDREDQPRSPDLFGKAVQGNQVVPSAGETDQAPVWQVHDKYIIAPTDRGVMIVDQHAAHERILYERVVRRFNSSGTKSQQLLFPQTIEMTAADAELVRELTPMLEAMGFMVKIFGKTTVILEGVPSDVRPGGESTILTDMLDLYKEDVSAVKLEPRERLAKSYSCRAAVKAGDRLTRAEMTALLDELFRAEVPYVCPHGRPVVVKLSMAELDRRFGRTS